MKRPRSPIDERIDVLRETELYGGILLICIEHNITVREALGNGRTKQVIACRRATCRWLKRRGFSSTEIGKLIGRDHSSVLHLLKKAKAA